MTGKLCGHLIFREFLLIEPVVRSGGPYLGRFAVMLLQRPFRVTAYRFSRVSL